MRKLDTLIPTILLVAAFVTAFIAFGAILHDYYFYNKVSSAPTEIELQRSCKYFNDLPLSDLPAKCYIFINK